MTHQSHPLYLCLAVLNPISWPNPWPSPFAPGLAWLLLSVSLVIWSGGMSSPSYPASTHLLPLPRFHVFGFSHGRRRDALLQSLMPLPPAFQIPLLSFGVCVFLGTVFPLPSALSMADPLIPVLAMHLAALFCPMRQR